MQRFGAKTNGREVGERFGEMIWGRVVLITGVSPLSLGSALATAIAARLGSEGLLILASRTGLKLSAVADSIRAHHPTIDIKCVVVDFSALESVRGAVGEVVGCLNGRKIDVLFNNAGINVSERDLNSLGVELQFATNHLGPFLFTNLLLPHLAVGARVVMTSSEAHRISPVRFGDLGQLKGGEEVLEGERPRRGLPVGVLRGRGGYEPGIAYGQSKTANVLFAVGLRRRGVRGFAVMPGTIMTEIVRGLDKEGMQGIMSSVSEWKSLDQGVATQMVAGFDPALDKEKGVYLDDCQIRRPAKWAEDPEMAERLWRLSEELVGEKFGFGGKSCL